MSTQVAVHKKYGAVRVLALVPTDRGGLARIATPWQGRGPGRTRKQPGPLWVRASSLGLSHWA
jgi:hypothetical protein